MFSKQKERLHSCPGETDLDHPATFAHLVSWPKFGNPLRLNDKEYSGEANGRLTAYLRLRCTLA